MYLHRFLSSVPAADAIMLQLTCVYARYGVVPVIESAVTTVADLRRVHSLLDAYDEESCRQEAN
jgi:hypothetical protein